MPSAQAGYWDAHAGDWASIQQWMVGPAARAALDELRPWTGKTLLDIGCGAGIIAELAHHHGADVTGLDTSPALIDIARRRVPNGSFHVGDMEHLPFPDATYDAVTAFNCLQHATDPATVLAEAIRVTRPAGTITIASWDLSAGNDALTILMEIGALMPPDQPAPWDPSAPGMLEALFTSANLATSPSRTATCPWHYPDMATALRGLLSTGPAVQAIQHCGHTRVSAAVASALTAFRRDDGSYLLHSTCRYQTATLTGRTAEPRQTRQATPPAR